MAIDREIQAKTGFSARPLGAGSYQFCLAYETKPATMPSRERPTHHPRPPQWELATRQQVALNSGAKTDESVARRDAPIAVGCGRWRRDGRESAAKQAPNTIEMVAAYAHQTCATGQKSLDQHQTNPARASHAWLQAVCGVAAPAHSGRAASRGRAQRRARFRPSTPAPPPRCWAGSGTLPRPWRCGASARTAFRATASSRSRARA